MVLQFQSPARMSMPLSNLNVLGFLSTYTIDKIVYENSSAPYTFGLADSSTVTNTIANPISTKCFITLAWSVDGTNYYPAQAVVSPTNPYTANGWVDNNFVYIYAENFSGSTQTFSIIYALDTTT